MNHAERLLSVNPKQQKTLRELAKLYRHLQLCKKRISRINRLRQIPLLDEEKLGSCLEQASLEVYKVSCDLLRMPWKGKED